MKYIYSTLMLSLIFSASSAFAEDEKLFLDTITNAVVKVCSTNPDGSLHVSERCENTWVANLGLSQPKPFYDRKTTELTAVTKLQQGMHIYNRKEARYVLFQHALAETTFDTEDGRSSVTIAIPSGESQNKYADGTEWIVNKNDLGTEVQEVPGFKVGDTYCLNRPPFEGFPSGIPVKITHLFSKDHFAVIDSVSKGFLGFGNIFKFYYTGLGSLVKCQDDKIQEKESLDPAKHIKTAAPASDKDLKVYDQQQAPKEVPSSVESSGSAAGSSAK
jgi:hypothetical protein